MNRVLLKYISLSLPEYYVLSFLSLSMSVSVTFVYILYAYSLRLP